MRPRRDETIGLGQIQDDEPVVAKESLPLGQIHRWFTNCLSLSVISKEHTITYLLKVLRLLVRTTLKSFALKSPTDFCVTL